MRRTKSQAIGWINGDWRSSQYATRKHGALMIDTDGSWGGQCKDLVNAYMHFVGGVMVGGNAIDLWSLPLPAGWQRIPNSNDFVPQTGDVMVYGEPLGYDPETRKYYGHTDICLKANRDNATVLAQNWLDSNLLVGSPPIIVTHGYDGFLGVIRPQLNEQEVTMPNDGDYINHMRALRDNPKYDPPETELAALRKLTYHQLHDRLLDGYAKKTSTLKAERDHNYRAAETRAQYLKDIASDLGESYAAIDEDQVNQMRNIIKQSEPGAAVLVAKMRKLLSISN